MKNDAINTIKNESKNRCEYCGITSEYKTNLQRHMKKCKLKGINLSENNETLKTNTELIDNLKCPFCKLQCSRKSSLIKHITACDKSNTQIISAQKEEIIKVKYENELFKEKHKMIEDKLEYTEKVNDFLKQITVATTCNMNNLIESNMRTINFLNKYVPNAPKLEHFNDDFEDKFSFYIDYTIHPVCQDNSSKIYYNNKELVTKEEFIIELITFLQDTKQTIKYFVDQIVYFYKNEKEPHKQSIWNLDIYRYNYTISSESDGKKLWLTDKQGQIIIEKILNPLFEFTSEIIKKKIGELVLDINELIKEYKTSEMTRKLKEQEYLTDFIVSIKKNELQHEIIKKLSPFLFFDVQKNKEQILSNNNKLLIEK
jgi:hypothetical protein